jgi:uncharacterized membrane protein/glutaredoxin
MNEKACANIKPSLSFYSLAVAYSLGLIFCIYLHYLFLSSNSGSLCTLFGTNCSAVIHSEYGSTFGFSNTTLGLCYFAFQLFVLIGLKKIQVNTLEIYASVNLLVSIFAILISLYFIYVLIVLLREDCLACYGVHLVNFIIFFLNLSLFLKVRHRFKSSGFQNFFRETKVLMVWVVSLLFAANILLSLNLAETKYQLQAEQNKLNENLHYYRYLYDKAEKHAFTIDPKDAIIGEKAIALYQIVLIYKDKCFHCRKAKEKLTTIVKNHDTAVYLILKNHKYLSEKLLTSLKIRQLPVVFIDGKRADGWDVPGFLKEFTDDCGC